MRARSVAAAVLLGSQCLAPGQTPSAQPAADWRSQGILYLDHSLNARLHTVPVQSVFMGEGFWSGRRRVTTEKSLPSLLAEFEAHGVVDNFRRVAGRPDLPRKGRPASDADLYKWLEAAAWALASNETSAEDKSRLRGDAESLISHIVAAQDPSGYLDTYFAFDRTKLRLTDPAHSHEDFCLGHLLQAGIAFYRATGERRLLDAGIRFANYLVNTCGPNKRPFMSGHPELEMALIELYRVTRDTQYLDFARYLFSGVERDRLKLKDSEIRYLFSGRPFTSRTELEGHAVRALYATSGATDFFMESGDPAFRRTLDLLWTDLTRRKMYVTGGVGSRTSGESFGDPYELPSESAYAESCASVANIMWNFRLLMMTGDARYADVLERTLYNAANAGMSLSGNQYCYRTPLASGGDKLRNPWYDVTCCPPNLERLFESLPGYLYATSRDGIYVNLYHSSSLHWHLEDGVPVEVSQSTDYPWSGAIQLAVNPGKDSEFTVYLRWPGWATAMSLKVNGKPVETGRATPGTYVPVTRTWHSGDTLSIDLPMPAVPMLANPRVTDDYGRLALVRGPLVYALEQMDQPGAPLGDIFVRLSTPITIESQKNLLNGVFVLKTSGQVAEKSLGDEPLYEPYSAGAGRAKRPVNLTFIPYYAVGNREPAPMEVWVPMVRADSGPALAGPYRNIAGR